MGVIPTTSTTTTTTTAITITTVMAKITPTPFLLDPTIHVSPLTTQGNPGASCKSVKKTHGDKAASGYYWINLSVVTKVYCDMVTDGGQCIIYFMVSKKRFEFLLV